MKLRITCNKIGSWYKNRRQQKSYSRMQMQNLKRELAIRKI